MDHGTMKRGQGEYLRMCQAVSAAWQAHGESLARGILFTAGIAFLAVAWADSNHAAAWNGQTRFNNVRINNAVNAVLAYLEGSFGALVMAAAGIGAIVSSSFGQYKAALSLMVVAVGAFILRSIMDTFFNTEGIAASG